MTNTAFTKEIEGIGAFTLKTFNLAYHAPILHQWVTQPYAKYWGMQDNSLQQVTQAYGEMIETGHTQIFMGYLNGEAAFLLEAYQPEHEDISQYMSLEYGDMGMHILMAPVIKPVAGFSYGVFQCIMHFIFEELKAKRIVVEPDHENEKIHRLNKQLGFFHHDKVTLPHKQAYLASCTQLQFNSAVKRNCLIKNSAHHAHHDIYDRNKKVSLISQPDLAVESIDQGTWATVNKLLLSKQLSEFSHERILSPKLIKAEEIWQHFSLKTTDENIEYQFRAQLLQLNQWHIDIHSIEKLAHGKPQKLDAIRFTIEFQDKLNIDADKLPTYLEEITSTLCSSAYKHNKQGLTSQQLCHADFQDVETAMNEGHPSFIANNGRIGFGGDDFRAYAPESATPITLIWLAAHKSRAQFSSSFDLDYETLFSQELDACTRDSFKNTLIEKGLNPENYILIPAHPWQWFNKLCIVYAPDIASQDLVCLGYGDDAYFAQQSIRTFFNVSQPKKRYVKTALSILNMGFMRGLSSYYMRTTPEINDWLYKLVKSDGYLQTKGFDILREVAAVGYSNPYYENELVKDSPYKKMLAALWRENPIERLEPNQRLMTMASLLHVDPQGSALVHELIKSSQLTIEQWLAQYFDAYLSPLLHCFYQHELVFMPHGENLIMIMENNTPIKMLMKDIGEEICLLNSEQALPENVQRISIKMPEEIEVLSIFTDVFDCFFRYLSDILYSHCDFKEDSFWKLVAECIHQYQNNHPHLQARFDKHDLFADEFMHSCLNRLQLGNNQQMIDLGDPSNNLKFAGTLPNPIASYRINSTKESSNLGKSKHSQETETA